jgi:hypothetical protein
VLQGAFFHNGDIYIGANLADYKFELDTFLFSVIVAVGITFQSPNAVALYTGPDFVLTGQVGGVATSVFRNRLATSIYGVYRGNNNVALTGDYQVTLNIPGSTAFNRNAATPVGNRGVWTNSVLSLSGLS